MSNQTVSDCESFLTDSENGDIAGHYDNDENLIFTICVPGADSIIITFSSFCLELGNDSLRVFDGPNISSPQLGVTFTGDPVLSPGTIPGTLVARSGCLTLHFLSDAFGVTCTGWEASWVTIVKEPTEPKFDPIANPTCNSTVLTVSLDQPVPCDSINPQAFSLTGPNAPTIISVTPVNCNGGTATSAQLTLSPPISRSGNYGLTFTSFFVDACNDLWELVATTGFVVNDCPLEAEIIADNDTICLGECAQLEAEVFGGDSTTYTFNWSNGIPANQGPHTVCPLTTTTYSLTADDAGPAAGDVVTKTIVVLDLPIITNPTTDTTVCRNEILWFTASPPGGTWGAPGMTASDSSTGRFRPWASGPTGVPRTITYIDPITECANSVDVTVNPFWQGGRQAACSGSAPFVVNGGSPAGGYFIGPFIDSSGLFTPSTPGSYVVSYFATNGCSGNKTVNVDSINVQNDDTVCITISPYYVLTFSPLGGRWSGPGIIHATRGRFNPSIVGPGLHTVIYTLLGGCKDTVNLFVDNIDAGADISACPLQTPFLLSPGTPAGGTWSGAGIVNSSTGLYDPSLGGGNFDDTLTYSLGGCTDTKIVIVRLTDIPIDSVRFCEFDTPIPLGGTTAPLFGVWSGAGLNPPLNNQFSPVSAGGGTHKLYFEANSCRDSVLMVVTPTPIIDTVTGICVNSSPFNMTATPAGGLWVHWQGNAITDAFNGTFDPGIAGIGTHIIIYATLPDTCLTTISITVDSLATVSFTGLDNIYCYKDTNILMIGRPAGGVFAVDGNSLIDSFFNPLLAGSGNHNIRYTFGAGDCAVSKSRTVFVGDSIEVSSNFTDSTICSGDLASVIVNADGGNGGPYVYSWNQGLDSRQFQTLSPLTSTTYLVTADDGCSNPATEQISITVFPEIKVNTVTTNNLLCFGEDGFAEISVSPVDNYSYWWNTSPVQTTQNMTSPVSTIYSVTVTNDNNGCNTIHDVELPGYDLLVADFIPNPNDNRCINLQNPQVEFIDLSDGATQGRWSFGDGTIENYSFGLNPTHEYQDTGNYTIQLTINNEGNCTDTATATVCVEQTPVIFAPASFTPNGDGINDKFRVVGFGIEEFEILIFSRWGELIYQSKDISRGWNGTANNEYVQAGGYAYVISFIGNGNPNTQRKKGMVVVLR